MRAFRWLAVDAVAPLLGVASTYFFTLSDVHLGIVLALFCGFFLYIGASDLLPESHHRHPKALTGADEHRRGGRHLAHRSTSRRSSRAYSDARSFSSCVLGTIARRVGSSTRFSTRIPCT